MRNYWDGFLDNWLYPLLAFFALCIFLAGQSRALDLSDTSLYAFPELEHMSHATQHEPFTDHTTKYGANMLGVGLALDWHRLNVELVESYNLSPKYMVYGHQECGEIMGPREQFSLRIRYRFVLL